jgi:hypothetical protein
MIAESPEIQVPSFHGAGVGPSYSIVDRPERSPQMVRPIPPMSSTFGQIRGASGRRGETVCGHSVGRRCCHCQWVKSSRFVRLDHDGLPE